jgi:hypothetical protein
MDNGPLFHGGSRRGAMELVVQGHFTIFCAEIKLFTLHLAIL